MATGTIIVADSQADTLKVIRSMLMSRAYTVVPATSGAEVLVNLAQEPPIDMVLAEMALPDMRGAELLRRVERAHRSTAVMLMAGFTEDQIDPTVPFILKPFTAQFLAARVEVVIAAFRDAAHRNLQLRAEWDRFAAANSRARAELHDDVARARLNTAQSRKQRAASVVALYTTVVLLVDDDPVWRYVVAKHLSQIGVGTLEAADGAEALALCRRYCIDVLVTDVDMPTMSGVVLAESFAREFPRVPIVFLTGGNLELPHPSVPKSCEPEDLIAAVRRACSASRGSAGA
jgi:CheY-like chemotaxis protein